MIFVISAETVVREKLIYCSILLHFIFREIHKYSTMEELAAQNFIYFDNLTFKRVLRSPTALSCIETFRADKRS